MIRLLGALLACLTVGAALAVAVLWRPLPVEDLPLRVTSRLAEAGLESGNLPLTHRRSCVVWMPKFLAASEILCP